VLCVDGVGWRKVRVDERLAKLRRTEDGQKTLRLVVS
jgi:hypothetical protein